jgi:hypothetical protein
MARRGDRIDEEAVCIDALVQCLSKLLGGNTVSFRGEPDDPPDYWISVAGRNFAVEVTAVTTGVGYKALCDELFEAVKKGCCSDSTWQGGYAVHIARQPEIPKKKKWKHLVSQTCSAIASLLSQPAGTECTLISDGHGKLQVVKLSDKSDFGFNLGLIRSPEGKWEGEAHQELSVLLANRIASKKEKIDNKGVLNVCPDVILALYDAYGYCSPEQARAALFSLQGYEWVHSIFWAASFTDTANASYPESPGRIGGFLFTKEESWRQ